MPKAQHGNREPKKPKKPPPKALPPGTIATPVLPAVPERQKKR